MRTNRFKPLSLQLCEFAVIECFRRKWTRGDVLSFIEKTVGIPRDEIILAHHTDFQTYHINEAIEGVGLFLYGIAEDLLVYDNPPEDFMLPVTVEKRRDGTTGKIRDIASLCILHQLLEHLAKLMMEPLLKAKILPTQHASIPGRGQTSMKRQVQRFLRRNKLGISRFSKTDVKQAYKNTSYELCISLVEKEIPRAKDLIKLLRYLATLAPGGYLIIGGYLDAWLFNFVASYIMKVGMGITFRRRDRILHCLIRIGSYMDDFILFSTSVKRLYIAIKGMQNWAKDNFHMELTIKVQPCSVLEGVDVAGYIIRYDRIKIRKSIWRRMRRVYIRAYHQLKSKGTIRIGLARKIVAYNGYINQSNSQYIYEKYHLREMTRVSRRVVRFHNWFEKKQRKETLNALRECVIDREAECCYCGVAA